MILLNNPELENIISISEVNIFDDSIRFLIEDVLHDLYNSNWPLLYCIRLKHLDRAVSKYLEASKAKKIFHTKNYFKACIKSAVVELGIDEAAINDKTDSENIYSP